jgi:hypothetical protein
MGLESFLKALGRRARTGASGSSHPVAEFFLWLLPLVLALMGHVYAWPKAFLLGSGPGFDIMNMNMNMNRKTIRAQQAWHFLNTNWPLFVAYGAVLLVTCALLRRRGVQWPARLLVLVALAVPGLWYWSLSSYLGGKLLGM